MNRVSLPAASRPSVPTELVARLEVARSDHLRLASWNKGKDRPSRVAFHHDTALALRDAIASLKATRPTVASVSLDGRQGEPAGMMTVTLHMSDGVEVPIIRDNGNLITHWARVDAACQQAATSDDTQAGTELQRSEVHQTTSSGE